MDFPRLPIVLLLLPAALLAAEREAKRDKRPDPRVTAIPVQRAHASGEEHGYPAVGAIDGDRFAVTKGRLWRGGKGERSWYWQADFASPVEIGAILQVLGDDETQLAGAPWSYVWQVSEDGTQWSDLDRTRVPTEHRMYRILRLDEPVSARHVRLMFSSASGQPPAVREVEFYASTDAAIEFPLWVLCVNSYEAPTVEECPRFLKLARSCDGWNDVLGQFLWHGYVDPETALAEPAPVCAFYSGSLRDWCEVDRASWQGTQRLLETGDLPMWGACGGAQAFGILSEVGWDHPWDCPKCRDPEHPKSPIYGHIGLTDATLETPCGDYSNNVFESGPTPVRLVQRDAVFAGLPDEFTVPENHCGQLEYLPEGWDLIVTKGNGGKTWMQCMKRRDSCIYAAQFHIELEGATEVSRKIMSNFLNEARRWPRGSEARHTGDVSHRFVTAGPSVENREPAHDAAR